MTNRRIDMFIKPTEFKKLAKAAWETGTLVRRADVN